MARHSHKTESIGTPQRTDGSVKTRVLFDTTNKRIRSRSIHFEPGPSKRPKYSLVTKRKVQKLYKELVPIAKQRKTEKITHLYHCTSAETKQKIQREGILRGGPTREPQESSLARNQDMNGVWFLASLYRGEPHTRSPYGPERIKIPVSMVMTSKTKKKCQLFFESTYMFKRNDNAQYIRMILANEDSRSLQWCMENLQEVDIAKNPLLCWMTDSDHMEVISSEGEEVRMYMEVLLLGDLELPQWDTVQDMNCQARKQPIFGLSSKLTRNDVEIQKLF